MLNFVRKLEPATNQKMSEKADFRKIYKSHMLSRMKVWPKKLRQAKKS